jgi:hypothetical protein
VIVGEAVLMCSDANGGRCWSAPEQAGAWFFWSTSAALILSLPLAFLAESRRLQIAVMVLLPMWLVVAFLAHEVWVLRVESGL